MPVITTISPRQTCQVGSCGQNAVMMLAPAMASTAATITQKYQYIQPTENPAQCPRPIRA
ncbi:hypothetical protein M3987_09555 [Rothia kristinae]|nr:hypothetical protein [Rothia kristinae]MCT1358177.1 hypothetical protein [Rothia kristinae]